MTKGWCTTGEQRLGTETMLDERGAMEECGEAALPSATISHPCLEIKLQPICLSSHCCENHLLIDANFREIPLVLIVHGSWAASKSLYFSTKRFHASTDRTSPLHETTRATLGVNCDSQRSQRIPSSTFRYKAPDFDPWWLQVGKMKASPLLISWHNDNTPIYSAHFEPHGKGRLATAGGDNNVRLWKVEREGEDRNITYLTTLAKVRRGSTSNW